MMKYFNYLRFVYKTLIQDLEKLKLLVTNGHVIQLITSLLYYMSVRLKLLELYDKIYTIGSANTFIDFSELTEKAELIQNHYNHQSPIDDILKILQYEHDCLKYLFKCHDNLENWRYIEALINLKRGCDIFYVWEKCFQNKETWRFGSSFLNKNTFPALFLWHKKFKHLTLSKFTLYFYAILLQQSTLQDMKNLCNTHNVHFFSKMQQLQKKSEAQAVILVFSSFGLTDYRGPGYCSPTKEPLDPYIKHQVMLSYPKVPVHLDTIEQLISDKIDADKSFNKVIWANFSTGAYLLAAVDLRVTLVMLYERRPRSEERDKVNVSDFVSQLRCHRHFLTIYK
ncbi:KICSTOR subunit 2-like isoform X2 [Adelges cooleyi]|uniref:KICSTOR subunit 2-like isoform X2 n=1 Tax=Adelges cooleyi TaxID=133065 RepID=UPI0021803796|nr:KICSTOR subunit 2-like isoform X2 [Adelges cooleyi]